LRNVVPEDCVDVDTSGCIRVLAISGSLRRSSSNTALVAAAARVAPKAVELSIYDELAELPPFNPDIEDDLAPAAVTRFRRHVQLSDAVLISSPEYAHGVPGVLKNALDWIVGSGELVDKPVALINSSARATRAWTSLGDTLRVMSARVITAASLTIPLDGKTGDVTVIAADADVSRALRSALTTLVFAALEARASSRRG
jgi:chromate reductase